MLKKNLSKYNDFTKDILRESEVLKDGVEYTFSDEDVKIVVKGIQLDGEENKAGDWEIYKRLLKIIEKGNIKLVEEIDINTILDEMGIIKNRAAATLALKRIANTRYKVKMIYDKAFDEIVILNLIHMNFLIANNQVSVVCYGVTEFTNTEEE